MKTHKLIIRLILLALLAGFPMAFTMAQTFSVYAGHPMELSVAEVKDETYSWELYGDVAGINFATNPGNCKPEEAFFLNGNRSGPAVQVTWMKAGIYFFKVTATGQGGSNNIRIGRVEVLAAVPTAILAVNPGEVCTGTWADLSLTFEGNEPWNFKLQVKNKEGTSILEYNGIQAVNNPFVIPVGPKSTTEYTVVELTDANGINRNPSETVTLKVNPLPQSSKIYVKQE